MSDSYRRLLKRELKKSEKIAEKPNDVQPIMLSVLRSQAPEAVRVLALNTIETIALSKYMHTLNVDDGC